MNRRFFSEALILFFLMLQLADLNQLEWTSRDNQIITLRQCVPAKIDPSTHKIDQTAAENGDIYRIEYLGLTITEKEFILNTYGHRGKTFSSYYELKTKSFESCIGDFVYCFNVLEIKPDFIKLELYGVYKTKEEN